MGSACWQVIGGVVLLSAAVACVLYLRARFRAPALVVRVLGIASRPITSDRGDWCVRVQTRLENHNPEAISIDRVSFEAATHGGYHLQPLEICGDKTKAVERRRHPPRLMMKLPITVPKNWRVDYTFDLFFEHSLRALWRGYGLRMKFGTPTGISCSAECPLPAPG